MTHTVLINGRFLAQRTTGVQRYALETLLAIDALLATGRAQVDFALELIAPAGVRTPELRRIAVRSLGTLRGHAWEQLTLARVARGRVLLNLGPTGPLFKRDQIVTIHDAAVRAVPEAYSAKFRAWYELALPILTRTAGSVVTVSEFSRGELARRYGLRAESIRVSGEGFQHALRTPADPSILALHGLRPHSYVLAVSSVTPHKNFGVIARAMSRLGQPDFQLVVAGDNTQKIFGGVDLSSLAAVKLVGYVSDGQLRALYENAALFVFPSLYEGFGLPPLEAMAAGCPVIASNAASMPEVCGDAAAYFEPHDDRALAARIEHLMQTPSAREALIARGRARLDAHSWEAAARVHLAALSERVVSLERETAAASAALHR